jgi:hypothetical protein
MLGLRPILPFSSSISLGDHVFNTNTSGFFCKYEKLVILTGFLMVDRIQCVTNNKCQSFLSLLLSSPLKDLERQMANQSE